MTSNNHSIKQTGQRLNKRLHILLRAYNRINKISHHLLSLSIKLLLGLFFIFCLLFLALRFFLIPQIGTYKPEIEYMLSSSLGRSVTINQVIGSWHGIRPHLELQHVAIQDEHGSNALVLPNVQATVMWLSLLVADVRLYNLEIDAPELDLKRASDGKIFIAGWWIDPAQKSDSRGLNWILKQRSIVIRNGMIKWTDQLRHAPVLTLSNMNFVMRNKWLDHRLSLTATPPSNLAAPLDIRADFKHHPFDDNISDFSTWKGLLYVDLTNTDLAAWKSYVDYPFHIQQGLGGIRFWFDFDQGKVVDITADLKLTNVHAQLESNLEPLNLKTVSGRISAQEIAIPANLVKVDPTEAGSALDRVRQYGHQIQLTNFSFETQSGLVLPPTTFTERFIPAHKKSEALFQFTTPFLDLSVLAKLSAYFPIPKEYRDLLKNAQPSGSISHFLVKLQGQYPQFSRYQMTGGLTNLSIQPMQAAKLPANLAWLPSFTHLTGHIDVNEKRGAIQVESNNVELQTAAATTTKPATDIKFDKIAVNASWVPESNNQLQLTLSKLDITQQNTQARFHGTHLFSMQPQLNHGLLDKMLHGTADLTGTISHIELNKVSQYLPSSTATDLRHWLTFGLLQGHLEDVSIRIKGNLTELPFEKSGLLDQNIFHIAGTVVDGQINYLPGTFGKDGVSPYWPILSKIEGKIIFDRDSMDVFAESGMTNGVPVSDVHARIPDFLGDKVMLEIDGTASGKAQDMVHYVSASPVLEWIGNFTQDTKMSGNATLKLNLAIPLSHPTNTVVKGEVQLANNDVALLKDLPLISQVTGRFNFDERGVNLNTLKGNFLGGGVSVTGGTQKDDVIRIKADGVATAEGIRKAYELPKLKNLLGRIDGKTTFSTLVQIKNKQVEIWVDSTLQGLRLNLPLVNKATNDKMPLHVEITNLPSSKGIEYDTLKVTMGDVLKATYFRQRKSLTDSWNILRGGIGVNAPVPTPDSGVSAHIDLTNFNVDELQALLPSSSTSAKPGSVTTDTVSSSDILPYVEPDVMSVHASELTIMGKKLTQVVLGATHSDGIWKANLASKQISGYLSWNANTHVSGHVTARLDSLIIQDTNANDVADLLQNQQIHSTMPGLDVIADNVELFGKKLGRLELQAKNVNVPSDDAPNEWQIESLTLTNADAVLTAKGKWTNTSNQANNKTDLNYQLTINDAGKLLDRLGYPHLIAGGKGKLNGDIGWYGSPYSMDMPTLSGKVQLEIHTGQFLKVDPGAAKLLAVLNLQNLPRRLILDFRDVFSEGFAFDSITGNVDIEHGVAKTDNFKMHSNSATVLLSGSANITNETQDLHVIVVPEVNATAASVLYGLAVNPVIGAGTFLAQLFLRHPLMKAFTFEYHITGSWKEPDIVKLSHTDGKH